MFYSAEQILNKVLSGGALSVVESATLSQALNIVYDPVNNALRVNFIGGATSGGGSGSDGKSAYQIWLDAGNSGTVSDFLASLIGAKGDRGDKGDTGAQGAQGIPGVKGDKGDTGVTGAQGLQGIKGDKGDTGAQGIQGQKGDAGANGQGVPTGGASGQILAKNSGTDFDTKWIDAPSGGSASLAIETTSSPVFGLLYNTTDDVYKRVGKNINYLTIDGMGEFSGWKSPTSERQNDTDTASPSPLTAWLDSSANLPYSAIKRYVIDNTGAEVKAYNANSYTHADQTGVTATQQVMVKIPAFYHIQARIVDGGKTYMLFAVANSSFTLDAISDLGFVSPTITAWNPTTGVSSGTVSGNTITSALHPAFVTNAGGTLTKRYYGAFNAVSGRSICGSGVKATGNITRTAARTSIQGFGTGFTQIDWLLRSALDILVIIERGSFYMERGGASLANKWEGYSWNSSASANDQDNGKTLSLLNKTGVILNGSNQTIANSWRGIENYHSALWNWVDGVNLTSNVVYLAKKGTAYDDSSTTTNGYFSSGVTVPSGATASYISDLGAGTFIPTAVSGSATTKITDGAWTGGTTLSVGGTLVNPSTSGVCAWNSSNAASTSGWTVVARPGL